MDVYTTYCVEMLDRLLAKQEHQNRPQIMDVLGMVKTCHVCLTILRFPNRTTTSLWTFWQPRATTMVKFGRAFPCYENLQQCHCLITKFPLVLDVHGMSRFSFSLSLSVSNAAPNEHEKEPFHRNLKSRMSRYKNQGTKNLKSDISNVCEI